MRRCFLGAGGETVGREIALRLGVALQRDKDVGQGTGEQFRAKQVVRFLKGPVLRRCNSFGFGGAAFHWVAQYTGRVLGSLSGLRFITIMKALHSIPGVMGCSSLILAFLALSGVYLWWPRKRIKIGLSCDVQGVSFDLHSAIGLFSSLFLLLFAITGAYMAFGPLFYAITHSKPVTQPAFSMPQVGLKPVSLDLVATAAKDTLPGATVLWIVIPRQPREAYFAKMRFPEDRSDNGSSMVWIDQFSGKVLAVASSRTAPLGNKLQNMNLLIHTGAVFGNGGRAFAAFVSLILVLQTVTGLQLWWNRRRRKVSLEIRS